MTTPANRAPKFVVIDRTGDVRGEVFTEEDARKNAAFCDLHYSDRAPHLVHTIGPALPAKVADEKSFGRLAWAAYLEQLQRNPLTTADAWDAAAAAVIAAHEAGRETERIVRYALRGPDGKWWSHVKSEYVTDRTQRRLWEDRYEVEKWFEDGDTIVKVTITTRRRRVVKS